MAVLLRSGTTHLPLLRHSAAGECYYDENNIIPDDDSFTHEYDSDDLDDFDVLNEGIIVSHQYRERGLDILSGGRDGFGAGQGVEKSGGGDTKHWGSAADARAPGLVGDAGVIMGGNFASNGNSNAGGGPTAASDEAGRLRIELDDLSRTHYSLPPRMGVRGVAAHATRGADAALTSAATTTDGTDRFFDLTRPERRWRARVVIVSCREVVDTLGAHVEDAIRNGE
jgi:hypothetical protein